MPFLANVVAFIIAHTLQIGAITTAATAIVSVEQVGVVTMELKEKIEAK